MWWCEWELRVFFRKNFLFSIYLIVYNCVCDITPFFTFETLIGLHSKKLQNYVNIIPQTVYIINIKRVHKRN